MNSGVLGLHLLFFAGFLLQWAIDSLTLSPYVGIHFVLLLTVACGLFRGPLPAEGMGFVWGLALDSVGATPFGMQGLALTLVGYLSGVFSRWIDSEEPLAQFAFSCAGSLLFFVTLGLLGELIEGPGRGEAASRALALSAFNTAAGPVVFAGFRWAGLAATAGRGR